MTDQRTDAGVEFDAGPPVLPALWAAKGSIVVTTIIAALIGFAVSSLQPLSYLAEAEILLADPRNSGVFQDTGTSFLDPSRYVRNQAELAESRPVMARAVEISGGRLSVEDLQERVSLRPSVDLDLLTITATDPTAAGAAQLADAVGQAYQDVVRTQVDATAQASLDELASQRAELQATLTTVERQLEDDPDDQALAAERDAAVAQLIQIDNRADQIAVDSALFGSGVELFEEAEAPEDPASPQPFRNAVLAAVLGALAAAGLAWWRADETATAEDRNDAAKVLRAPLLGRVPDYAEVGMTNAVPTVSAPQSPAADAYHFLVGALEHAIGEAGSKTVLITSPRPTDGKTVTALNLAIAASRDGREVVLVDADTRVRGLTRMTKLRAGHGLQDLAHPEMELADVIDVLQVDEDRYLPVVPGVDLGEDAAAFFRTPGFRAALRKIADPADLVLIDSPPLLLASDTSAIASSTDGIVVVIARGTPLRLIEELRERLDHIGTPVLGYVFTKARMGAGGYYDYNYRYGYAYGYGERGPSQDEPTADDAREQPEPASTRP